jgi:uncharacterized protein (DUF433 family)
MADFNDLRRIDDTPGSVLWSQGRSVTVRALGRYILVSVMSDETQVVHSDPEILSGTPVFVGTRVPVRSLFDYIEGGDTLDEFLRQFPSVRREQAIAALELARESLLTRARTA